MNDEVRVSLWDKVSSGANFDRGGKGGNVFTSRRLVWTDFPNFHNISLHGWLPHYEGEKGGGGGGGGGGWLEWLNIFHIFPTL